MSINRPHLSNTSFLASAAGQGGTPEGALVRIISLHLSGNTREALEEVEAALLESPESKKLLAVRGHLQCEQEQYDKAVKTYSRLVELAPAEASGLYNLGVCLEKLGLWADAAERFAQALKADPSRIEPHLGLGICHLHMSRPESALAAFNSYLELNKEDETALFGKAVSLQLLLRLDEAETVYEEVLAKNPFSAEATNNLLTIAIARGSDEVVTSRAEQLLSVRPDAEAALEGLASVAFRRGEYELAARYCRKLVQLTPDRYDRWFNFGVACHKLKKLELARNGYIEAIRIQPDSEQAYIQLGIVYQELRNYSAACKSFEAALRIAPGLSEISFHLADLHEQNGHKDEAEAVYEKLLEQNPNVEEAWFRLGFLRMERSNFIGSAQAFKAALRIRAVWPEALINLALAQWKAGAPEVAASTFERILAGNQNSVEALRGLAAIAVDQQDLEKALEFQARLIDLGDRSPELFYNTGLLLQRAGQLDDAIRLYQEALQERPGFDEALINLGHALKESGQPDDAKTCWIKAVRTKPESAEGRSE